MKYSILTDAGKLPATAQEIGKIGTREMRRCMNSGDPITEDESVMAEIIARPSEFTDEPMPEGGHLYQAIAGMVGYGKAARSMMFHCFLDTIKAYQKEHQISSLIEKQITCCHINTQIKEVGIYCHAIETDWPEIKAQIAVLREFFELMAATMQYQLFEETYDNDDCTVHSPVTFLEIEQYANGCLSADFRTESNNWEKFGDGWLGKATYKDFPDQIELVLWEHYDPASVGFDCEHRNFVLLHKDLSRFPWKTEA